MKLKAFVMLVIVGFTVDLVAFDSFYRDKWSRSIKHTANEVSSLHWTGFIG